MSMALTEDSGNDYEDDGSSNIMDSDDSSTIDEQERRTEEISEESDNGAIDLSSKLHELHNQMNEKDANKQRTPTYADKTKNATNVDHKDESKNIEAIARVAEELRKDFQKDADRLKNAFNSFGAIWHPEVPMSPSKNLDDSMDE